MGPFDSLIVDPRCRAHVFSATKIATSGIYTNHFVPISTRLKMSFARETTALIFWGENEKTADYIRLSNNKRINPHIYRNMNCQRMLDAYSMVSGIFIRLTLEVPYSKVLFGTLASFH